MRTLHSTITYSTNEIMCHVPRVLNKYIYNVINFTWNEYSSFLSLALM